MEEHINSLVTEHRDRIPLFIYFLADHNEQRVATSAPIHAGDLISVQLENGTKIDNCRVGRVHHLESPLGKQSLNTFLYLEA